MEGTFVGRFELGNILGTRMGVQPQVSEQRNFFVGGFLLDWIPLDGNWVRVGPPKTGVKKGIIYLKGHLGREVEGGPQI